MADIEWLMFVPQIPSTPSSLRVLVWRRMRAAGAIGIQQGIWLLPNTSEHAQFIRSLREDIKPQGGSAVILIGHSADDADESMIIERFRADRDQEYDEFCEQAEAFLAEVRKETRRRKFSFAELEEREQDLRKLTDWLQKIHMRDFYGAPKSQEAKSALVECQQALRGFTRAVYEREGLHLPDDADDPE